MPFQRDKPSVYHVWRRRRDGYVGATCGYKPPDDGTFEHLLSTEDWRGEAVPRIIQERDTDEHRALMASWNEESTDA
jgi:hypothetical protein